METVAAVGGTSQRQGWDAGRLKLLFSLFRTCCLCFSERTQVNHAFGALTPADTQMSSGQRSPLSADWRCLFLCLRMRKKCNMRCEEATPDNAGTDLHNGAQIRPRREHDSQQRNIL